MLRFGGLPGLAALSALGLALAQPQLAPAAEPEKASSVELQAEAQREVGNDTLNAVLFVELNDADPARLADAINRATAEAAAAAKEFPSVRSRSGSNQTFPVYDRAQKLTGWRGRAELRMESRDFQAAASLIGRLQARMQLGQITFSVSPEVRRAAEDELIAEAIRAFRTRAEIVRITLAGRGYRIRRMNVATAGGMLPPRPLLARAAAAESVAPPRLEGGASTVTVTVSGAIDVE